MNEIKKQLIEFIELGYDFDATVDLGNGGNPMSDVARIW